MYCCACPVLKGQQFFFSNISVISKLLAIGDVWQLDELAISSCGSEILRDENEHC